MRSRWLWTLPLLFAAGCAARTSTATVLAPAPIAKPAHVALQIVLHQPGTLRRLEVRDPYGKVTARCAAPAPCAQLSPWFTIAGMYRVVLEFAAADGIAKTVSDEFLATYDQVEMELHFGGRANQGVEWMQLLSKSSSIEGVALRVKRRAGPAYMPELEVANGARASISVYTQGGDALIRLEGVDVNLKGLYRCGTGTGTHELGRGETMPASVGALMHPPPLLRGRYRATITYGVNEAQLSPAERTGRTYETSVDFEISDAP